MSSTTVDLTAFNAGMARFVKTLSIEAPRVVKKESGGLLKELVKTTPAADSKRIGIDVRSKLTSIKGEVSGSQAHFLDQGVGKGGVKWFAVNKNFVFGVAPEMDARKSSADDVRSLYYRIRNIKKGRWSGRYELFPLKNKDKRKAAIMRTVLTTKSQASALSARIQKSRGRLKAGWLTPYDILQPTGANMPPAFVMRHKSGARGYYIDGLGVTGHPSFAIANTATGVGNKKNNLNWIVKRALTTRAIKMAANALLFMRGKKHVSDY